MTSKKSKLSEKFQNSVIRSAQRVLDRASVQAESLRDYVGSEDFESDLDDLGVRLGLSSEDLKHSGAARLERVNHKLKRIAKHSALDLVVARQGPASIGFKRLAPVIGMAWMGTRAVRILFHCYQVYMKRKGKTLEL